MMLKQESLQAIFSGVKVLLSGSQKHTNIESMIFSSSFDKIIRWNEVQYDINDVPIRNNDESTEKFSLYDLFK